MCTVISVKRVPGKSFLPIHGGMGCPAIKRFSAYVSVLEPLI